jgi:uncharacterized protein with gpF-like domain
MTSAAISSLYTSYKRFTVSRATFWKPKIHASLMQMIRNATNEPSIERAIKKLDENMLKASGLGPTLTKLYQDAGRVWGGKIYRLIKQEERRLMKRKAMMPIGINEEMMAEILAYFRLHVLNGALMPITDTMKEWIYDKLVEGQKQGLSIQQVANNMTNADFPAKRAIVIARTETIKAANKGAMIGAKKTGLQMNKVWIAARDNRTRRIPRDEFSHASMYRTTIPIDEPFMVPNRNGSHDALMEPGDPTGEAADVIECRCTVGFEVVRDARGLPVRL